MGWETALNKSPKLVAHIIYRLDFGGLENGLVNLVNRIPQDRYHHAIVCMTGYTDFSKRITNPSVTLHALNKSDGKDFASYLRLWKLLRELKPDIVHTRNLSGLEGSVVARIAGVPYRVHGEHGRDLYDIQANRCTHLMLRRFCKNFIDRYIPLSNELEVWLESRIMVPTSKLSRIYNGVDTSRFRVREHGRRQIPLDNFDTGKVIVIGTVGRLQGIKDHVTLVEAFSKLSKKESCSNIRLVIVGDGPMMQELKDLVKSRGVEDIAWLAGVRDDIPELLQAFDIMVLPSKSEGISNTILEAMATGLPVVATNVGGNKELVVDSKTGALVPKENPLAMCGAIQKYISNPDLMRTHGLAGRKRVEEHFSISSMVEKYVSVYDSLFD